MERTFMYDAAVLNDILEDVPQGLNVRPLCTSDYDNGYLQLLGQLTSVGDISREAFVARFNTMCTKPQSYYVTVIEDLSSGKVVGSATLVIEWKFIHEAGSRGRIEDVVVDSAVRGKKLGGLLNKLLVKLGRKLGVYKMSLECTDALIPFYELFGYKHDGGNFLVQRFDRDPKIVEIPSNL